MLRINMTTSGIRHRLQKVKDRLMGKNTSVQFIKLLEYFNQSYNNNLSCSLSVVNMFPYEI